MCNAKFADGNRRATTESMTKGEVIALVQYDAWAAAAIIREVETLSSSQYEQDMGASHGGIQGTLSYIFGFQSMWLARWCGLPNVSPSGLEIALNELSERWAWLQSDLFSFVNTMTDEKLAALFRYRDHLGNPQAQPLWQQLQHIVNQASYHRGQVALMLRQCGVSAPQTDLMTFYREFPPSSLSARTIRNP